MPEGRTGRCYLQGVKERCGRRKGKGRKDEGVVTRGDASLISVQPGLVPIRVFPRVHPA